ncbi:Cell wall assembly regulator [Neofusicoccum ribis]|uniref:Cell wall assembly regulator n=1 Tax=Neofusicoccum ribis TaxID=45134 RepID=A0ABR3SDP3_9PEZI
MTPQPNMLTSAWRDFWHTMTSNDRHASHDSPYRTGQHVPLPQSRHTPLTSVATSAMESRTDFNSPYAQDEPNGFVSSPRAPMSPSSPYSPGMRSSVARPPDENPSIDAVNSGEIQMQSFSDGLPPPPPVGHSWKRIDRWLEDRFVELWDNMCEGATHNDVNELEHILDVTLPVEVRESLQIHDGQERGGLPTGLFFGCMILDCEEIVQEYTNWRRVNEEFLAAQPSYQPPQVPIKAVAGPSSSPTPTDAQKAANPMWRQDLLSRQDSQPPNAIQKAYAHPAWIPLARDWGGNCLAVDLAPGPAGKWGQVIIFGRDYDTKYVVARSWAAFLAQYTDDLCSDKCFIDEETNEMKLKLFAKQNVEPPYLDILRWRCDQKYGRKPKRRPQSTLSINPNAPPAANGTSPYGSPSSAGEDRGRSPHRLSKNGASPRVPISSPLARVAEEAPAPIKVHTDEEKLIEMNTPRPSSDLNSSNATQKNSMESDKENSSEKGKGKSVVSSEEMKTVEI